MVNQYSVELTELLPTKYSYTDNKVVTIKLRHVCPCPYPNLLSPYLGGRGLDLWPWSDQDLKKNSDCSVAKHTALRK